MRRIVFTPRPSGFRFYHTTIARGQISTRGSTAARLDLFTSSPSMNPEATTARCLVFRWSREKPRSQDLEKSSKC
jgi:hypothetical protein